MDRLLHWIEQPIKWLMWSALGFCFLMMAHIAVDVAGRVLFNHPLDGTTEAVSAYYMVAVAYLPLAWVTRQDDHIVVELFTRGLRPTNLLRLRTVMNLAMLVYIAFFSWQSLIEAIEEMHAGEQWETAQGYVHVWPSRWMLPIAGFAMTAFLVLVVIRDALLAFRRDEGGEPS